MSYQVLARKWRPRRFDEVVGQEHVLRALMNALDQNRLHHAYLFTGTRGVGKTTLARILSKCLNCEQGVSSQPCGECPTCVDIDAGRFFDLIEVDAASRTKVEDTRELLDNVPYAPSRGRYKVYLIDEVHMFSRSSFNALLKTLEEPPEHVKFLLATTDPQKLPVTVLSRCLQLSLKRMPAPLIVGHLERILEAESVPVESTSLGIISRAADGSMRDALSLLDQAIGYGDGAVTVRGVESMLGQVSETRLWDILEAIVDADIAQAIAHLRALDEFAPDYEQILADMIVLLHQVALQQTVPDPQRKEVIAVERLAQMVEKLNPAEVQLFYQILLRGRSDLPLSPDLRQGMEMLLMRMVAFRPSGAEFIIADTPAAKTSSPSAVQQGRSAPAALGATQSKQPTPNQPMSSAAASGLAAMKAALSGEPAKPATSAVDTAKPVATKTVAPQPASGANLSGVEAMKAALHGGGEAAFDSKPTVSTPSKPVQPSPNSPHQSGGLPTAPPVSAKQDFADDFSDIPEPPPWLDDGPGFGSQLSQGPLPGKSEPEIPAAPNRSDVHSGQVVQSNQTSVAAVQTSGLSPSVQVGSSHEGASKPALQNSQKMSTEAQAVSESQSSAEPVVLTLAERLKMEAENPSSNPLHQLPDSGVASASVVTEAPDSKWVEPSVDSESTPMPAEKIPNAVQQDSPSAETVFSLQEVPDTESINAKNWPSFVDSLLIEGMAAQLAANTGFISYHEGQFTLQLDSVHTGINRDGPRQRFIEVLCDHLSQSVRLVFEHGNDLPTLAEQRAQAVILRQQNAEAAFMADPLVKTLTQQFGARIQEGSIEPLEHRQD